MALHFWFYVSRSKLSEVDVTQEIGEIVKISRTKNAALGITGALIYNDFHFGQIVEGPAQSIMALRSSVLADHRHTDIKTIGDGKVASRRFGHWDLAYSGGSMVMSRTLQRALRDAAQHTVGAGDELLDLMEEVVTHDS